MRSTHVRVNCFIIISDTLKSSSVVVYTILAPYLTVSILLFVLVYFTDIAYRSLSLRK